MTAGSCHAWATTPAPPLPLDQCRLFVSRHVFHFSFLQGRGHKVAGREQKWWGQSPPVRQEDSTRKHSYPTLWMENVSLDLLESPPTILQEWMTEQLSPVGSDSFIYHLCLTPPSKSTHPEKCLNTVDYFKNWSPVGMATSAIPLVTMPDVEEKPPFTRVPAANRRRDGSQIRHGQRVDIQFLSHTLFGVFACFTAL